MTTQTINATIATTTKCVVWKVPSALIGSTKLTTGATLTTIIYISITPAIGTKPGIVIMGTDIVIKIRIVAAAVGQETAGIALMFIIMAILIEDSIEIVIIRLLKYTTLAIPCALAAMFNGTTKDAILVPITITTLTDMEGHTDGSIMEVNHTGTVRTTVPISTMPTIM